MSPSFRDILLVARVTLTKGREGLFGRFKWTISGIETNKLGTCRVYHCFQTFIY